MHARLNFRIYSSSGSIILIYTHLVLLTRTKCFLSTDKLNLFRVPLDFSETQSKIEINNINLAKLKRLVVSRVRIFFFLFLLRRLVMNRVCKCGK